MAVSVTLSDGDTVLVYRNGGLAFEFVDSQTAVPTTAPVQVANQLQYWLDAKADSSGGFTLAWVSPYNTSSGQIAGQLYSASYDAAGALVTAPHAISSWTPSGSPLAFTSVDNEQPNGQYVEAGGTGGSAGSNMIINLSNDWGYSLPEGPPLNVSTGSGQQLGIGQAQPAALAGGGAALLYAQTNSGAGAAGESLEVALLDPAGNHLGSIAAASLSFPQGGSISNYDISGLADGGFVVAWEVQTSTGFNTSTSEDFVREFAANGAPVGDAVDLGAARNNLTPVIVALPDGAYSVSWTDVSGGVQHVSFTEQGSALAATNVPVPTPPPTGEHMVYTNQPAALSGSAGWTGAAVLSNHLLAVVDAQAGQYGSTSGAEQTYDWTGVVQDMVRLQGYAGPGQTLTPEVAALPVGGFFQVNYAGSTAYEVYNANDKLVFQHNQYTSPTAAFAPLASGGYVVTDTSANVFGLFDPNANNVGWISMPADAAGAPTVTSLVGGGFVFTYAGSGALDFFDSSGHLLGSSTLGDAASSFSSATAALANTPRAEGGLLDVWLSPDGGQFGLPTTIELQAFDPSGVARFAPIQVGQDLDPWHTTFQLQAHQDGSAAVLWSQGGGIFGAEYNQGTVGQTYAAVAGDLSTTGVIQLNHNAVGLTWVQGGDAWAEIFDPSTGVVHRVDLGATTGDLSTVHALALYNGGMAVSWRTDAGVEGQVLTATGQVASASTLLMGDLLGVGPEIPGLNGRSVAYTVADDHGAPFIQFLSLSDTTDGFWVH